MENAKVCITGGAGFIGSHLAEDCLSHGALVTIVDNFSRGKLKNIRNLYKNVRVLNLDLRESTACDIAVKNQDIVFNLAAFNTGVDYDVGHTHIMFKENMLLQMLPIIAAVQQPVKMFVQVSSASIYSPAAMEQRIPTNESDDKGDPEPSKLGYALAKQMGEHLARWCGEIQTMKTVIARFTNVYGPRDHFDKLGHFIPTVIRKFHNSNTSVEIFGSGSQRRSFLHVKDATQALLLLSQKGENGEAYNIDPHDEHSIKEIVFQIRKIMNKTSVDVLFNQKLPEGSKRRLLDNAKIKNLGWVPQRTLMQSLPTLVDDITKQINP